MSENKRLVWNEVARRGPKRFMASTTTSPLAPIYPMS